MPNVYETILKARIENFRHDTLGIVKGVSITCSERRHLISFENHTSLIWFDLETAHELRIIPDNYKTLSDMELNEWLRKNLVGQNMNIITNYVAKQAPNVDKAMAYWVQEFRALFKGHISSVQDDPEFIRYLEAYHKSLDQTLILRAIDSLRNDILPALFFSWSSLSGKHEPTDREIEVIQRVLRGLYSLIEKIANVTALHIKLIKVYPLDKKKKLFKPALNIRTQGSVDTTNPKRHGLIASIRSLGYEYQERVTPPIVTEFYIHSK